MGLELSKKIISYTHTRFRNGYYVKYSSAGVMWCWRQRDHHGGAGLGTGLGPRVCVRDCVRSSSPLSSTFVETVFPPRVSTFSFFFFHHHQRRLRLYKSFFPFFHVCLGIGYRQAGSVSKWVKGAGRQAGRVSQDTILHSTHSGAYRPTGRPPYTYVCTYVCM